MKSYYWLLAALFMLSFGILYLFFDGVQNIEHVHKTDEHAANSIDSIQKSSIENCYTCSFVSNDFIKT